MHKFTASEFSLGFIPLEVIEYHDEKGGYGDGVVQSIIQRKIISTGPYVYESHIPGITTRQMYEIYEIARDYPQETAYELLTRRYPDDIDGKVAKILLDRVRCYNSRLLQYVGKTLTAMETIMGCTIPLIVIAHLATQSEHISMVEKFIE
jgi:hypothetical protein